MKKRINYKLIISISTAFLSAILLSCSDTKKMADDGVYRGISLNEFKDNETVMNIIQDYIEKHPKHKTFIVAKMFVDEEDEHDKHTKLKGILVGSGYRDILAARKRRKDSLNINGRNIYVIDSLHELDICYKPEDLDSIKKDWFKKSKCFDPPRINAVKKYIYNAIYIDKKDREIIINDRADTLYGLKIVQSSIKFEPPVPKGTTAEEFYKNAPKRIPYEIEEKKLRDELLEK